MTVKVLTREMAIKAVTDAEPLGYGTYKAGSHPEFVNVLEHGKFKGSFRVSPNGTADVSGLKFSSVVKANFRRILESIGYDVVGF